MRKMKRNLAAAAAYALAVSMVLRWMRNMCIWSGPTGQDNGKPIVW